MFFLASVFQEQTLLLLLLRNTDDAPTLTLKQKTLNQKQKEITLAFSSVIRKIRLAC